MSSSVVKSAGRVFEVLELFDSERQAMTATAVARALKYPASSTVALLKSMVELGYLAYELGDRTYFPTIQLATISRWIEDSFFIEGHLLELMDDVGAATSGTVMLCWQNELHMQFVRSKVKERLAPDLTSRLPLFESVVGLTALMVKRDVEIAQLAERCNAWRSAGEPKVDLPAAMEHVRNFRTLGYGVGYDFFLKGWSTIAWALRHRRSARCIVVSVFGPTDHLKPHCKAIVHAVKEAIRRYTGS